MFNIFWDPGILPKYSKSFSKSILGRFWSSVMNYIDWFGSIRSVICSLLLSPCLQSLYLRDFPGGSHDAPPGSEIYRHRLLSGPGVSSGLAAIQNCIAAGSAIDCKRLPLTTDLQMASLGSITFNFLGQHFATSLLIPFSSIFCCQYSFHIRRLSLRPYRSCLQFQQVA
jgi:hypothetical protein